MNPENIIPNSERTPTERQEIARAGGIASGEARRRNKRGRELLQMLLDQQEKDQRVLDELAQILDLPPEEISREVSMHARQIDKAVKKADTKAYNAVLKAAGYHDLADAGSTFNLNITTASQQGADNIDALMKGGKNETAEE